MPPRSPLSPPDEGLTPGCFSGSLLSRRPPVVGTADHRTFPGPPAPSPPPPGITQTLRSWLPSRSFPASLRQCRARGSEPCPCLSFTSATPRGSSFTPSLQTQPTCRQPWNSHTSSTGLSQHCELELTALLPRRLPWVMTDGPGAQPS